MLAERYLHVSIEAMLYTAHHIIAAEGFRKPLQFRDCFAILGEEQVIPPAFAQDIVPLVGLRNRLVHVYADIDHNQIYAVLTTRLGDMVVGTAITGILSAVNAGNSTLSGGVKRVA